MIEIQYVTPGPHVLLDALGSLKFEGWTVKRAGKCAVGKKARENQAGAKTFLSTKQFFSESHLAEGVIIDIKKPRIDLSCLKTV